MPPQPAHGDGEVKSRPIFGRAAASYELVILGRARRPVLKQIQRGINLLQQTFDFLALVTAGVFLQSLKQLLFSRQ